MPSVNMTSLSHPHCTYYMYDVFTNWFFVIINVLMAITTVVGNAFVFLTVFKTKSLQRPANLLLCSLALCDFAVGFVVQPLGVTLRVAEIVCATQMCIRRCFGRILWVLISLERVRFRKCVQSSQVPRHRHKQENDDYYRCHVVRMGKLVFFLLITWLPSLIRR